jgi:hypothetical protein
VFSATATFTAASDVNATDDTATSVAAVAATATAMLPPHLPPIQLPPLLLVSHSDNYLATLASCTFTTFTRNNARLEIFLRKEQVSQNMIPLWDQYC